MSLQWYRMGLIEDHHWWWFFEVLMHSCLVPFARDHFFHLVWCEKLLYKILVWRILHPGQVWVVVQRLRGVDGGHVRTMGWAMGCEGWVSFEMNDLLCNALISLRIFFLNCHNLKKPVVKLSSYPCAFPSGFMSCWCPCHPLLLFSVEVRFEPWLIAIHISFGLLHQIVEYWQDIIRWCPRAQVPSNIYVHLLGHFSLCQTTWLEWPFVCSFQLDHIYGEGSWPLESVLSDRLCAEAREVQGGWRLQISVSCGSQFLSFVTVFQC